MTNLDATIATPSEGEEADLRFIAARILSHPDPGRVGDFAPLFDPTLDRPGPAVINRLKPDFRAPGGTLSGPLASPRISRSPLEISRSGDGLRVLGAPGLPVEVNGEPISGAREISAEELTGGAIILLGRDLVLWIGWLDLIEPAPQVAGLVGESTVMRQLRQQIHRVADLEVPVLLRGETGVGKELVATAIHRHSRRASGRYVAVNVAGIPATMAASELFGHRRGSFTGASAERKGYFAQANGGTLFLDEIGDISFDVQALLLRAVQEGVIQPIGGSVSQVDVRLIAATDSDLESAVARRAFREPLLRRFSYEIHVPPLRARRDDIGLVFFHLLRERLASMDEGHRLDPAHGGGEPFVPGSFVARLALSAWPGNVRELANVALKFAVENRGRTRARTGDELRALVPIRGRDGSGSAAKANVQPPLAPPPSHELTEGQIVAALEAEGFRLERAAQRLKVSKSFLYRRIESSACVPRAGEIPIAEIQAALAACKGSVAEAAKALRISSRALRLQFKRIENRSPTPG